MDFYKANFIFFETIDKLWAKLGHRSIGFVGVTKDERHMYIDVSHGPDLNTVYLVGQAPQIA
jgi:hypothetical protein